MAVVGMSSGTVVRLNGSVSSQADREELLPDGDQAGFGTAHSPVHSSTISGAEPSALETHTLSKLKIWTARRVPSRDQSGLSAMSGSSVRIWWSSLPSGWTRNTPSGAPVGVPAE